MKVQFFKENNETYEAFAIRLVYRTAQYKMSFNIYDR